MVSQSTQCSYYEEAFEHLNEAVYVTTETMIIWCNQQAVELLGYDNIDQLVGKPNQCFLDPRQHQISNSKTSALYRTGKGQDGVFKLLKKDGSRITCVVKASRIESGDATYMIVIPRPLLSDELDEKLIQFLDALKHEVNDPLMVIWGYAELIHQSHELHPEVNRCLEIIIDNVSHLGEISKAMIKLENLQKKET
jgi:PAS domain S-box-containing protein